MRLFSDLPVEREKICKGTFISYANLLTHTLSPSSNVGVIDAPEIELRSATALLKKLCKKGEQRIAGSFPK